MKQKLNYLIVFLILASCSNLDTEKLEQTETQVKTKNLTKRLTTSGSPEHQATLFIVEASTVELGEGIGLGLNLETIPGESPIYDPYEYEIIHYEIKESNATNYNQDINSLSGKTNCAFKALQPGEWNIRAWIRYPDGEEIYSNTLTFTVLFPHVNNFAENLVIESAMFYAWEATKDAASPTGRYEKAFTIYANTTSGSLLYEIGNQSDGPTVSCGTQATNTVTYQDDPKYYFENGGIYMVGVFHTHTPVWYCTTVSRPTGPSTIDNNTVNSIDFDCPGIVIDYEKSPTIFWFDPIDSDYKIYTFGNNERRIYH